MKRRKPGSSDGTGPERTGAKAGQSAPGATAIALAQAAALEASFNEAVQLQQNGRLVEASAVYRRVLDAVPGQPDAAHMLAIITFQLGDPSEAVRLLGAALETRPDDPEMHNNLAIILNESGAAEKALVHFDRALRINPAFPEAHNNRGNALRNLGRLDEARAAFERAVEYAPEYAQAYSNLGITLLDAQDAAAAKTALEMALRLAPDNVGTMSNLGAALQDLGEFDAALATVDRALQLDPNNVQALNNKGHVLQELDRFQEAEVLFRRAIELQPRYVDAYINLGLTLQMQNRPDAAIETLRHGIAGFPENPDLHWNLALALLQTGSFADGWQEYEWRWRMPRFNVFERHVQAPQWRGEQLAGKTLYVHAEQGLGDTLHFSRYLPEVLRTHRKSGARVIFECAKPLAPLFRCSPAFDGVEVVTEAPDVCDRHTPLLSLPGIVGTTLETVPADIPYLMAPSDRLDKWASQIGHDAGSRVGLVWAGSAIYQNDFRRSIPFDLIKTILPTTDARFFSLQVERLDAAQAAIGGGQLIDIGTGFSDFADTAAAVHHLDLVITVDTAVAHLAGAMGKPVWLMLPKASDWRWLLGRDTSPWYPTLRLFRQQQAGDWPPVIEAVSAALSELLS